jgi:hypothetical protein
VTGGRCLFRESGGFDSATLADCNFTGEFPGGGGVTTLGAILVNVCCAPEAVAPLITDGCTWTWATAVRPPTQSPLASAPRSTISTRWQSNPYHQRRLLRHVRIFLVMIVLP